MLASLSDLAVKLGMHFGDKRVLSGIRVSALAVGNETELLERVEQALQLIGDVDPRQLRHIQRDLSVIWIRRYVLSRADYKTRWNACSLDADFVGGPETQVAQIAASIIHEATHARLHRAGIVYEGACIDRIERVCRKAELAFGKRCPGGELVIERAAGHLALPPGALIRPSGELEQTWRATRRRMIEELPVPKWIRHGLLRLTERRTA